MNKLKNDLIFYKKENIYIKRQIIMLQRRERLLKSLLIKKNKIFKKGNEKKNVQEIGKKSISDGIIFNIMYLEKLFKCLGGVRIYKKYSVLLLFSPIYIIDKT